MSKRLLAGEFPEGSAIVVDESEGVVTFTRNGSVSESADEAVEVEAEETKKESVVK